MFRAMFLLIIRRTCLYLQHLVVFTQIAAGWCLGRVEIALAVSTHPRHKPAAIWVNITRYCKYSQVPLMMCENITRKM
jgi:hypothetical protein